MACKKKSKSGKKEKSYVCVVCKGNDKIRRKKKCCSPKMLSKEKGSWNL